MNDEDDEIEYLKVVDTVRTGVNVARLGNFATILLRNERKCHSWDYEVIDDVKDIVGADNLELLREFVEIVLIHGAARNTFLAYQARKAHTKQRRKAAQELKKQQQSEAAARKNTKKQMNAEIRKPLDEIDPSNLPELPDWVKQMTGVK